MEKVQERDSIENSFSTKAFVRALSYRDFISSISLALLLLAVAEIIDYYSIDDWIGRNSNFLKGLSILLLFPLNHIIYKLEHNRANNFIGRNLHDYIFLLSFFVIAKIKLLISGNGVSFGAENAGSVIFILFAIIILVMIYEVLIAVLKRILKLVRWQIL